MLPRICSVTILDEEAGQVRTRGIPTTWTVLRRELPQVAESRATPGSGAKVVVALARWAASTCDPTELDRRLHAATVPIDLQLVTGAHDDERAALEVLTRAQIFLPPATDPVRDADGETMERVLALVDDADWHAHDMHRWVLRLRPNASAALRIAALFHDAELHAPDDRTVRDAQARTGARILGQCLRELRLPTAIVDRAVTLVADHERNAASAEGQSLADADALSFFSRDCPAFLDHHGREPTLRRVEHMLARIGPGERWRLSWIKLRADVAEIVREVGRAEACA
jgi:hypothetical protein